jgi:hypothetical protein
VDILLLYIAAMVCGVESIEDTAFFGETREAWLKKHLELPNGIPSAGTILRVLGRIDRRRFEACFLSWTRGLFQGTGDRWFSYRDRRENGAGE